MSVSFEQLSSALRVLSAECVEEANSGHLGLPLGFADCLTVLFEDFCKFDPEVPNWPNRDRFVLSAGHGSALLYSLLYLLGYNISIDDLKNFRKFSSITTGHPELNIPIGIEFTTGPLGQGIGGAVGIAIAQQILRSKLSKNCINHKTYVCASDGDLMEGVAAEACSLAGHLGLSGLIVLLDDNKITIDGAVDVSNSDDVKKRFESYRWNVESIDGHNQKEIRVALSNAQNADKPCLIMCRTKIGKFGKYQNSAKAHSGALGVDGLVELKKTLGWPISNTFTVPEDILQRWRQIGKQYQKERKQWEIDNKDSKFFSPNYLESEIRKSFRKLKKEFFISRPFEATRVSSGKIIQELMATSELVIGGACDLGKSTCCMSDTMVHVIKEDFSGNYINFGIREHAMGSIANGIVLHSNLRFFGGTFLAFSDYMKPAIRLSAIMNIPVIYVFSHDSIGVGEDGPTHQPVEQLAGLRAIPNLNVFRPCDAMETCECWQIAMSSRQPSAIILTRQNVFSVRFCGIDNLCSRGGYLLYEDKIVRQHVTLIATGSEVGIALEAKKILNEKCISVNLVSLPCWRIFDMQDDEYKKHVLGDGLRVGIEAGCKFGWEKYLCRKQLFVGVNDFGKSGPYKSNYEHFGLTANNIADLVLKNL